VLFLWLTQPDIFFLAFGCFFLDIAFVLVRFIVHGFFHRLGFLGFFSRRGFGFAVPDSFD
jgi:hypothetical protein